MALFDVLLGVTTVTVLLLGVTLVPIVGVNRLVAFYRRGPVQRIRAVIPYFVFLGLVLVVGGFREAGADLSWIVGIEISSLILDLEGGAVIAWLQSFQTPAVTAYFSAVYVYGYIYLLVFPFIAYVLAEDLRPFRVLSLAYAFNYVVGVILYVLFIAYGPRNYPIGVEQLLYDNWPQSQLLTSQVNVNTNVFPSLHASVSTTIGLLAIRTRDVYPRWPLIAVPLAASVCVATMYLAIHWATDVVAGVVLAGVSVWFAERYHDQYVDIVCRSRDRVLSGLRGLRQRIRSYRN
ncbi:MAG: phosphatase PAP2 family protein [Halapricum sp.]